MLLFCNQYLQVSVAPLEVVHETPHREAGYVDSIFDSVQGSSQMLVEEVNPALIDETPVGGVPDLRDVDFLISVLLLHPVQSVTETIGTKLKGEKISYVRDK